ncbi:HlyIII-domain-containing protein [Nadsonia fulvescens var. elongata DSM 6958]|uniref:HlyIII-domain-containing protein n=1 Tax=Nadsonia fulvescens var. elongata DSM 6958 TaxID=857566 RepID=A0A1E3PT52_9ASCO|nr:HlyIII-domain-containing protein [Nadsonia fulvescens var. elongata DSM 6958]
MGLRQRHATETMSRDRRTDIAFEPKNPHGLCTYDQLPEWQKDNEHILDGYVRETNSYLKTLRSLMYIHNESVNIYSHLVPAILFAVALAWFAPLEPLFTSKPSSTDMIFLRLFPLGAFLCLFLSATFHTLKSHSHVVASFGNSLDYLGITFLIASSMISLTHFSLPVFPHDHPSHPEMSMIMEKLSANALFTGITFSLGVVCVVVCLHPSFRLPHFRSYRATMFILFGLSGVLPVCYSLFEFGFNITWHRAQLGWILAEGLIYILGAVTYALRIPERFSPGSYDYFGHSHQIFHFMVVIAAICHARGLWGAYEVYRKIHS